MVERKVVAMEADLLNCGRELEIMDSGGEESIKVENWKSVDRVYA